MIVFVSDKLLKSTVMIGENIYAPADDGTDDLPEELQAHLAKQTQLEPMVNVQPTEAAPTTTKKG